MSLICTFQEDKTWDYSTHDFEALYVSKDAVDNLYQFLMNSFFYIEEMTFTLCNVTTVGDGGGGGGGKALQWQPGLPARTSVHFQL